MANIFRYTIDDCNRIMFILKEYVDKKLRELGYPEDKKYFNYYLYLEIFENRTEETLQELLEILNEWNNIRGVNGFYPNTTEISCFYYTYINRKISGSNFLGGTKKIYDKEKIEKYCNKVIESLLLYKQLFRMQFMKNYEENLLVRLNKLSNCYFDSVIVGIDELRVYNPSIISLMKKDFNTLNDYLKYILNNKIDNGKVDYLPLFAQLNVLPNYFDIKMAKQGFLKFRFPFNLYIDIFNKEIMYSFLSTYNQKYDKYIEYKLKEIIKNKTVNNFKYSNEKEYVTEYIYKRNIDIIFEYYKNYKTASEICVKYGIGYKAVLDIKRNILSYIRRNPKFKNYFLRPNLIIEELKEKKGA